MIPEFVVSNHQMAYYTLISSAMKAVTNMNR